MRAARRPALSMALGAALLALTACGGSDAGAPGTPAVTAAPALEILQFSAPLVGGQGTFDGASVAGRPVAFWFWAPT